MREAFKAATEIENEGVRVILLQIRDQEVQQEGLSGAGAAENHGVRDILVVEIEKVRCVVAGFEDREILLPQMGVAGFAAGEREQERVVGVVGIEKIKRPQVPSVVAGNGGEEGVQQVVALVVQLRIMNAEYLVNSAAARWTAAGSRS